MRGRHRRHARDERADITVCTVELGPSRFRAELAVAALRAAGITCSDVVGDTAGQAPDLAFQLGVRTFVRESDLDAVRRVLGSFDVGGTA